MNTVAITQQFLNRVDFQSARIISIWIAAGDAVQPMAYQSSDRVADLARLASVVDADDQRLQQDRPQSELACCWSTCDTTGRS